MSVALVQSQFAELEEPAPDEHPIVVSIGADLPAIAAQIMARLPLLAPPA